MGNTVTHGSGAIRCGRSFHVTDGAGTAATVTVDLRRIVRDAARRQRLTGDGGRVLVALSGGADSVALLHALWSLRNQLGITVCAAHLNHRLRGRAAAADAVFARAFAKHLGVRFVAGSVDVRARARRGKHSLETAARDARKRFLADAARRLGCGAIATGHTRNDQAETVLMRLIRGTGLTGLAGIPRRNGAFIRPLLDVRRDQVLAYLADNGLAFRTDQSNDDTGMTRNRIRHQLIPALAEFNPRIVDTLARLADTASEDLDAIDRITEEAFARCAKAAKFQIAIDLTCFNGYNISLRRNILRRCTQQFLGKGVVPDFDQVERALALLGRRMVGKRCELGGGLWIEAGYREALVTRRRRSTAGDGCVAGAEIAVHVPGMTQYHHHVLTARIHRKESGGPAGSRDPFRAWFDWDELQPHGLMVGVRKRGELIVPFGARHPRKIKELMIDAKIPRARRAAWPVVRTDGAAIWIPGLRRSNAAPVTPATRRILHLEYSSDEA